MSVFAEGFRFLWWFLSIRHQGGKCKGFLRISSRSRIYLSPGVTLAGKTVIDCASLHLGEKVVIARGGRLRGKDIHIKRGASLNPGVQVEMGDSPLSIGAFTAISNRVSIWGKDHDYSLPAIQVRFYENRLGIPYPFLNKGPISIGNDVLVGERSIILPGVTIGDGAIVGAGSVVVKDIPAYAIAAGVPARIIGNRFDLEVQKFLLRVRWWDWSWEKIKKNSEFFSAHLHRETDLAALEKNILF